MKITRVIQAFIQKNINAIVKVYFKVILVSYEKFM